MTGKPSLPLVSGKSRSDISVERGASRLSASGADIPVPLNTLDTGDALAMAVGSQRFNGVLARSTRLAHRARGVFNNSITPCQRMQYRR